MEAEIRKARGERNKANSGYRAKAKARIKEIGDAHIKEATKWDRWFKAKTKKWGDELEANKHRAGVEYRADKRSSKSLNKKTISKFKDTREKLLNKAQKEKVGGEKELRRAKARSLKQINKEIKRSKNINYGDGSPHLLTKEEDIIRAAYGKLIEKETNQKKANKLVTRMNSDVADMHAMRDRLMGTYMRPSQDMKWWTNMGQAIRAYSYLTFMGMMTLTSAPDIGRPLMKHGASAFARGMLNGFPTFFKKNAQNLQRQQLQDIGISVEALLSSRALLMADVQGLTGLAHTVTEKFTKLTLMNRWNDMAKHVAAITAQHKFLTEIKQYDSLSPKRKAKLKMHGFDEEMIYLIKAEEPEGGWERVSTALMANTNKWVSRKAAHHFETMLLRDTEMTIVTPGVADSPLFMSKEEMKLIFQFKSFFFASHTRAFLPMMQQMARGDLAAFMGLSMQMALAAMVEPLRLAASGRLDELGNYEIQDWMYVAFDRSGAFSLPFHLLTMIDVASGGQLSQAADLKDARYAGMAKLMSLGPGLGLVENALELPKIAFNDRHTEASTRKIRNLLAAQNLFYTRWLFNMAEDAVNDATNAKKRRRR